MALPEQVPAGSAVSIAPEAAAALYKHLQEQGRQQGTVRDLEMLLARAVERKWETTDSRRFNDKQGGGWLIDLSSFFNGEMLYGMVRSSVGGSRLMVTVVDADEMEEFSRNGRWQSTAGELPEDAAALEDAARIERGTASDRPEPVRRPVDPEMIPVSVEYAEDAPTLLIVYECMKEGDRIDPLRVMRMPRSEVPAAVKKLLSLGVYVPDGKPIPVDEGMIEIWSDVSRPKVEVKF